MVQNLESPGLSGRVDSPATLFDSEDDYHTGCQNVSHCQEALPRGDPMSLICILKRLLSVFIDASCRCGKLMKILCLCRNLKKWIVMCCKETIAH